MPGAILSAAGPLTLIYLSGHDTNQVGFHFNQPNGTESPEQSLLQTHFLTILMSYLQ
jgi:hypothetical protein